MENPCKKCLLQSNCTEVCFKKKNYGVLLDQQLNALWDILKTRNSNNHYWKDYRKIQKKIRESVKDEQEIDFRSMCAQLQF